MWYYLLRGLVWMRHKTFLVISKKMVKLNFSQENKKILDKQILLFTLCTYLLTVVCSLKPLSFLC